MLNKQDYLKNIAKSLNFSKKSIKALLNQNEEETFFDNVDTRVNVNYLNCLVIVPYLNSLINNFLNNLNKLCNKYNFSNLNFIIYFFSDQNNLLHYITTITKEIKLNYVITFLNIKSSEYYTIKNNLNITHLTIFNEDEKNLCITYNFENVSKQLLNYLHIKGHTNLSLFYYENTILTDLLKKIEENSSNFTKNVSFNSISQKNITKEIYTFLDSIKFKRNLPTCIILEDETLTKFFLKAFKEKKILTPYEISLISLIDSEVLEVTFPAITSINYSTELLAEKVIKLLKTTSTESLKINRKEIIECDLIIRSSVSDIYNK